MNYRDILNHETFPFSSFEQDDLQFLLLEKFWIEFIRKCLSDFGYKRPWYAVIPAQQDGNPIIFVGSVRNNKAIRVIIRKNEEGGPYPEWALSEEFLESAEEVSDEYFEEQLDIVGHYFDPIVWTVETLRDLNSENKLQGVTIAPEMSEKALRYTSMIIRCFLTEEYEVFSRMMNQIAKKERALVRDITYNGIRVPEDFCDILCASDNSDCINDWIAWIDSMFAGANWP